jgi:hypothetical protein
MNHLRNCVKCIVTMSFDSSFPYITLTYDLAQLFLTL